MGKHQPTPPPAPDPNVVSAAQTASNQATAQYQSQLNNGNSYGPYGSVTNVQDPNTHQWTQTTQLSPAEQAIFNQGTQAQGHALTTANTQLGRVDTALGQTLNTPNMQTSIQGAGPLATGYNNGGQIATGFNPGQAVQGQIGPSNFGDAVNNTINAQYAQARSRLDPQWSQAGEQNNAQMIAQGLNPNDAAWTNNSRDFNNARNDAYDQALYSAIGSGNAEQNTLFGQQATQGEFANTAAGQEYAQNQGQAAFQNTAQGQANTQNQAQAAFQNTAQQQQFGQNQAQQQAFNSGSQANFQNQAYAQQLPINEFNALMSSGQVTPPQPAQLSQTGVGTTDVLGAYGLQQGALQSDYQAQMQNYQSSMNGLYGLGSAVIGLGSKFIPSDARLKRDIAPLQGSLGGLPLYSFRYAWDDEPRIGVMAQDALVLRPEIVAQHPDGYLMVDYGRL